MKRTARFNDSKKPLVSIVLHNNNNEVYLRQCLDSILSQNYDNIEISLYDYASNDDSWKIATSYQKNNPGIITLLRMRQDYLLDGLVNHMQNVRGKYFIRFHTMCEMKPGLVEKCVNAFETNRDVAFVKIRKLIENNSGEQLADVPLYNVSSMIPGIEHLPAHLMSNPEAFSSVTMFNTDIAKLNSIKSAFINDSLVNESYISEANLCLKYNMAYINEPLFLYRETKKVELPGETRLLIDIFNLYNSKVGFIKSLYHTYENKSVIKIFPDALKKLSELCLTHCISEIKSNNEISAHKYYHLAATIDQSIETDTRFVKLSEYWNSDSNTKEMLLYEIKNLISSSVANNTSQLPLGGKAIKFVEEISHE